MFRGRFTMMWVKPVAYLNPRAGKPSALIFFRLPAVGFDPVAGRIAQTLRSPPKRVALPPVAASSLKSPPPLATNAMRIIPLGGLGDVGRNMAVLEFDGELLLVDCGVLFPEDHHPGVDLILPGFDAIADRLDDIVGLVLTHGHEDHIGAVPYLLRQRPDIPLIGSKLTLALVRRRSGSTGIRGPTAAWSPTPSGSRSATSTSSSSR